MVKLAERQSSVDKLDTNGGVKLQESKQKPQAAEANIDRALVRRAREQLRRQLEAEAAELGEQVVANKYSRAHLEQIMAPERWETCWRYLAHTSLNVDEAVDLMRHNLVWRQENKVDSLRFDQFPKELFFKIPMNFTGRSRSGHELIYATGKNYRKPEGQDMKQLVRSFLSCIIFTWDREHQHDLDKFILVFDVSNTTFRNMDLDFSAWLISLRDLLPSRILACYIVGVPFLLRPLIRLIVSWMDERLRRLVFLIGWQQLFDGPEPVLDLEAVPKEAGGSAPDTWRLAPVELPWPEERGDLFSEQMLAKIDAAIFFQPDAQERLVEISELQRRHEAKLRGEKV